MSSEVVYKKPSVLLRVYVQGLVIESQLVSQPLELLAQAACRVHEHVRDVFAEVDLAVGSDGLVLHQLQVLGGQLQLQETDDRRLGAAGFGKSPGGTLRSSQGEGLCQSNVPSRRFLASLLS